MIFGVDSQQYTIIDQKDKTFINSIHLKKKLFTLKEYIHRIKELIIQQQKNEKTIVDMAKRYLEENLKKQEDFWVILPIGLPKFLQKWAMTILKIFQGPLKNILGSLPNLIEKNNFIF